MTLLIFNLCMLVGVLLVSFGAYLIMPAAGFIVGGTLILAITLFLSFKTSRS